MKKPKKKGRFYDLKRRTKRKEKRKRNNILLQILHKKKHKREGDDTIKVAIGTRDLAMERHWKRILNTQCEGTHRVLYYGEFR